MSPSDNASAGDATLAERLAHALASGQNSVAIPKDSSLGGALILYRQLLEQASSQSWFSRKGLATDTLTLRKDRVEGFTTVGGVRTAVASSVTDDSDWGEASRHLRAMRNLLDPDDKGLPYVSTDEPRMPLHVVLNAYGLDPGESTEQKRALKDQVAANGLTAAPRFFAALDDVRSVISDLDERAFLADLLGEQVQNLADGSATDWSTLKIQISPASAKGIGPHPSYDVAQLLEHKGLGVPRTAAATRNVIRWLRTVLPPAPPLGDYSGLIPRQPGDPDYKSLVTLALYTPATLSADPDAHLRRLSQGPDAVAFGNILATVLDGPAGSIGGYALYSPRNAGRTLGEVRQALEQHLRDTQLMHPNFALLVAHVALARVAPEFLVRDVPEGIKIGTSAWTELRLGCAMAECMLPGTSRMMDEEQVCALTGLEFTSEGQRTLMQEKALGILLDWGVLNGVIPDKPQGQHTQEDLKKASSVFSRQRALSVRSFNRLSTVLPSRRQVATQELLKAMPQTSLSQLEAMTVHLHDSDERRNLRRSEPRTRSLIETYMSGDLIKDRWVLTTDMTSPVKRPDTPYSNVNESPTISATAREKLNEIIERLPALDPLLERVVSRHHADQQMGFVTKLKLMFAGLPLADRQRIELGKVELFTLRKATGKQQVWESDLDREAVTARQGTLMRVLHDNTVTYYEVLYSGNIIKHDSLEVTTALDKVAYDRSHLAKYKLLADKYIRRGHEVGLDFNAYSSGAPAREGDSSSDVILDKVGVTKGPRPLPDSVTKESFVPDTYQSDRIEDIAVEITEHNFYESAKDMLARAKGQLPVEKSREAHARDLNLLLSLVPFVGAYQDFRDGDFGKGLQSLALDGAGLMIGAGGQARSLIRSLKTLVKHSSRPSIGRFSARVAPHTPKGAWSWNEPKVRFSDAAFDLSKQTALFWSAVLNPVDGYPRLISAASKGLSKLPSLRTVSTGLSKAMPHLMTIEEKMRCYFLVGTGLVDPTKPPGSQAA
ncbi:hypothetical protein LVW35_15530 [Pseudomonas sp. HN11]|uniref:hypothetical protein n=1 Tax=Pseudomonas sp. HN11 TaxID=1344094 RepID=UPI001F3BEBC8|nr:hypothetical protein [Pseudomonas sp. HN11]UII69103.1 hypothetical protein LVW35_15530 [Pseudomonas sp. HN11]